MRGLFLALVAVSGAAAQTAVVPASAICPADQMTVAKRTGAIGTTYAVVTFSCIRIDPATVALDTSTTPPTLRANLPPEVISIGFQPILEIPTGPIDGVNRAFALSHAPITPSILVFLNGVLQTNINIVGSLITFVTAPPSNSQLRVFYWGS